MAIHPLLSIVIPAYNVESYISQCLDSLISQTSKDFHAIIINDGSTDKTLDIIKRYANDNPTIFTYYSQENKGLGATRNRGIDIALNQNQSQYITFLDSDDWVPSRYVEFILRKIQSLSTPPDILFTLPIIYNMATVSFESWHDCSLLQELFPFSESTINIQQDLRLYDLEPSVCRRVFSSLFLQEINYRFPEGTKWEDIVPHYLALHFAKRCAVCLETGFFYRINSGNQITASTGSDRFQAIEVYDNLLQIATHWSDCEIAYLIKGARKFTFWALDCCSVEIRPEYVRRLHRFMRTIPKRYYRIYLELCRPSSTERFPLSLIRNPILYALLKDEHYYLATRKIARLFRVHC